MSAPTLVVALEGSARPASLAAARGEVVVTRALADEREHASDLVPELAALLATLGARAADVELVVVGLGPGSYTGLRVAAATALGLALGARGAALVGVPSFEALALGAIPLGAEADVLVDARGGHLYHAAYRRHASDLGSVEALSAPAALTPEEARAALRRPLWLADADALRAAGLTEAPAGVRVVSGARAGAEDLLRLGLARFASHGATALDALTPLYLRSFTPKVRTR